MSEVESTTSWKSTFSSFLKPQVIIIFFLGISAGTPLALIFSSLSLWLTEAGITESTVTAFSWAALAYSFKFIWAPIIDRIPLPVLTKKLGRRRAWILLSQLCIIAAIIMMGSIDPSQGNTPLQLLAFATVFLGFSSATQDIVIDAYRIESAKASIQALLASGYIAGYRVGMLISGAGALILAESLGSTKEVYLYEAWQFTYYAMSATILIGVMTTLIIREPKNQITYSNHSNKAYVNFFLIFVALLAIFIISYVNLLPLSIAVKNQLTVLLNNKPLASFLIETVLILTSATIAIIVGKTLDTLKLVDKSLFRENYYLPVKDFFDRYGKSLALMLLLFIGFYRVSDIVLGVIANVFYLEMGYSKHEIAAIAKTYGLIMMIGGGFFGGVLTVRYGVIKILFLGAFLTVATNLLFILLALAGYNTALLTMVISADNFTAGLASAAFIAFLSSLTNVSFTAVQYAIFSSLMTLLPKIIGGYSGSMVENIGYTNFFIISSLMGVPILWLIFILNKKLKLN